MHYLILTDSSYLMIYFGYSAFFMITEKKNILHFSCNWPWTRGQDCYSGHMNATNKESQESKRKNYIPKSILSFWFL